MPNASENAFNRSNRKRRARLWVWVLLAMLATAIGGGLVRWLILYQLQVDREPSFPPEVIRLAASEQILRETPVELDVFRFAPRPQILILSFATLQRQGRTLNRLAALIEKPKVPRDRLLSDAQLRSVIEAEGASADTFYYGHDYRAADVRRFFTLAAHDGTQLTIEEQRLLKLARREGWMTGYVEGALISIPSIGGPVDATTRATILRHELAHAEYFANPTYAAFVNRFWTTTLSEDERRLVRIYLAAEGYDTGNEDLMMNELQAYLAHTNDRRFFDPDALGIPDARLNLLRQEFLDGMPNGWLRDSALDAWRRP